MYTLYLLLEKHRKYANTSSVVKQFLYLPVKFLANLPVKNSNHISETSRLAFFAILTLVLAISCTPKQKQVAEQDFDKTVMHEIFPSLIDSMYVEIVSSMMPPPVEEVVNSATGKKEFKPVDNGEITRQMVKDELALCQRDSVGIFIVLDDSIHSLAKMDREDFRSMYPMPGTSADTSYLERSYPVQINKLPTSRCFNLKIASAFKRTHSDSLFRVRELRTISFSRIIFDATKTQGMLTCEYICGSLCGNGYRVYIQKANGKWTIHRIDHVWVA